MSEKRQDTRIGGKGFGQFFITAWNVEGKFVSWNIVRRYKKDDNGKSVWEYTKQCSFYWKDISDLLRLAFWVAFLSDQWLAEQKESTPDHLRKKINQSRATSREEALYNDDDESAF